MMTLVEIIIPLGSFAMIFGIVYVVVSSVHREKMAMIEAGMDPNVHKREFRRSKDSRLRTALLFLLVPIGILVGRAASPYVNLLPEHSALVFAFFFGGIAYLISYLISVNQEQNKTDKEA